jgi:hypothetical protein
MAVSAANAADSLMGFGVFFKQQRNLIGTPSIQFAGAAFA